VEEAMKHMIMIEVIREAKEELKILLKKNNIKISTISPKDLHNGAINYAIEQLNRRKR
jgi:hypothetical protein